MRTTGRNLFFFQPISEEKFQQIELDFQKGIPPSNQVGLIDLQMFVSAQSALARLRERDVDLADFLQHLDTKVNLVLKKISKSKSPFDNLKHQELNLAGNGIAFFADKEFSSGTLLEFHIVLLPDYCYVYCFGRVVNCQKESSDPHDSRKFRIACEFCLIMEEDRENLVQHNFKQQTLALRNRRRNKEES